MTVQEKLLTIGCGGNSPPVHGTIILCASLLLASLFSDVVLAASTATTRYDTPQNTDSTLAGL